MSYIFSGETTNNELFASGITFDGTRSGLAARNVQAAIEEIKLSGSSAIVFPSNFSHWHDESVIEVGGTTLNYNSDVRHSYYTMTFQSPGAIGDTTSFTRILEAGTYKISMLLDLGSNRGKFDVLLNGTVVQSIDTYSATFANSLRTFNVTVTTSGLQVFKIVNTGKNASSSNFFLLLSKVWGHKV